MDGQWLPEAGVKFEKPEDAPATTRMFYAAYFRRDTRAAERPVVFLYNSGPGSSSMWLHMGPSAPNASPSPTASRSDRCRAERRRAEAQFLHWRADGDDPEIESATVRRL